MGSLFPFLFEPSGTTTSLQEGQPLNGASRCASRPLTSAARIGQSQRWIQPVACPHEGALGFGAAERAPEPFGLRLTQASLGAFIGMDDEVALQRWPEP